MILSHALQQLFPTADFRQDIILANDGNGDYISRWNLPEPIPSSEELEAAWQEWMAGTLDRAKSAAINQVNVWANERVLTLHILEPELFYVAMISNVAFRLLEWIQLGRPEVPDPNRFIVTYAEAKAYSETSHPEMTPTSLLQLQEQKWVQMQQGFASVVYKRRLVLEKIGMASTVKEIGDALSLLALP